MRAPRGWHGKAGWTVSLAAAALVLLAAGSEAAMRKIDFDGDGLGDLAVYRTGEGAWYVRNSSGGSSRIAWGDAASSDIPVAGDYDNDSITDAAVWRPTNGTWYIRNSSGGSTVVNWGDVSLFDVPVPADYDGDGMTDIAVWRASTGTWYIRNSSGGNTIASWGDLALNDRPVPGDYDGDGSADIAVWRASTGTWYVKNSSGGNTIVSWGDGSLGDQVTLGDFDGDGIVDPAVWRASTGYWYVKKSTGGAIVASWGDRNEFDVPYPVYYDNDNSEDIAVWRRVSGTWYVKQSSDGMAAIVPWGTQSEFDTPVTAFIRPLIMDTIGFYKGIQDLANLYATSIPDNTALDPIFHPSYLDKGRDKATEIASWTSGGEGPPIGFTFSDVQATYVGGNPARYIVRFILKDSLGTPLERVDVAMARSGTSYALFGDQAPIETDLASSSNAWVYADNTVSVVNGIKFDVGDWSIPRPDILSVRVTGPGIPTEVLLDRGPYNWFPISGSMTSLYPLDDATIAAMGDMGGYLCQYYTGYAGTGTLVAATKVYLMKRPTLSTELSPESFPALVSPTSHALAAANPGGVLEVSWTNPAGTFSDWASLQLETANYNANNLGMNQTAVSFDSTGLPFTPNVGSLMLNIRDKYDRLYQLNWEFRDILD